MMLGQEDVDATIICLIKTELKHTHTHKKEGGGYLEYHK